MKRKLLYLLSAVVMMTAMAGCGSSGGNSKDTEAQSQEITERADEAGSDEAGAAESTEHADDTDAERADTDGQADAAGDTRVVNTEKGEAEIPADPQRIADISGMSDILYILGRKPVATADADAYNLTEFPSYLAEELDGARIVGYSMSETVDIEGVLASEPDLIIINPRQEVVYDQLSQIAPTIVINPDVNDWRSDLRMVAELFDEGEKAEAFIVDYEEKAKVIGDAIKEANGEDATYYSFLTGEGSYYLFTGAAYGDIFYNDMGLAMAENLPEQDSITLPVVELEGLTEIESDYILILASDEHREALENSAVFNSMEAVQNGNVIWVPQSPYFNQPYSSYGKYQLLDELQELLTNS